MEAHEVARQLEETRNTLTALATLDAAVLRKSYAPGKWTASEIFAHLADGDAAFFYRFLKAVAEDRSAIVPFDENVWQHELEADRRPAAART